MHQTSTVVSLLNVGIRLGSRTKAVDKVRLMPLVRKIPFVLIDHLSSFNDDLPSATMATEVHHRLCAIDFDSCRRGRPVRPLGTIADFAGELAQIPRGITTLTGHREVAVIVRNTLEFRYFSLRLKSVVTTDAQHRPRMSGITQHHARQVELMAAIIGQRAAFVIPPWMPIQVASWVVGHGRRWPEPGIPIQTRRRI